MAAKETSNLNAAKCLTSSLLDLSIEDLNTTLTTNQKQTKHCTIHTEQCLYFYCKKCHEPICRDCTVVTHKDMNGHRIFELNDLYQEYSTKFNKQKEIADADKKALENYMNSCQKKISELDSMKRRLEKEIEDDLNRNIEVLKRRGNSLRQAVSNYCDTQKKSFQSKHKEMSVVKDQIDKQLTDFELARNEDDIIATFQMYREMKAECKARKIHVYRNANFRVLGVVYDDEATFQRILQSRGKICS